MAKMSMLGVGMVAKANLEGKPTLFVEYHKCDLCDGEFRLYFRTEKELGEALEEIGRRLSRNGKEDLCFACQSEVPDNQMIMNF